VALDAALPAAPRPLALVRGLTARVGLTAIVLASFAARVVASALHPVPRLFPDEYLYTAIARSLAHGHAPAIRGAAAHFPALLAPIAAAPLQALAGPEAAYRLTQAENALFMSLAAIPVYLLARRVELPVRHALACAAFAVAIPDLVFASYTLSDPVAYPLVLAAVAAGVAALDRPSKRSQLLFLAFAGLATFARVQYVVLPVAFLAAGVAVDRRRVLRTQRLPIVLCALPLLGALALGPSRALGYYSSVTGLHVGVGLLRWTGIDLFLLAYASGMVLVPGALVALARPRGRTERVFAALTVLFSLVVLGEAALYSTNGSARFHERYLFALLPLVPIAFGLYAKHGYPGKRAVLAIAAVLFLVSARLPLAGYVAGTGKVDSPFLVAVSRLQPTINIGDAAFLCALAAAAALVGAVAVSRRGGGTAALVAAVAIVALMSVGAVLQDGAESRGVQRELVMSPRDWVDQAHVGPVTLIQTRGAQQAAAVEQLYWNPSIEHELLLGNAIATDAYPAPKLHATPDGHLPGVDGAVLVQNWGATVRFQNATVVSHAGTWSLWNGDAAPQLSLVEDGRYYDDWLTRRGRLTVWPDASGRVQGTLSFSLWLPPGSRAVTMRFGGMRYRVEPGRATIVSYAVDRAGVFSLSFSASRGHWLQDMRGVSVKSSAPVFRRAQTVTPAATTTA
jgi:hypothetical protein